MNITELKSETLRLVNLARVALGKDELSELPKGYKHSCRSCPIANALYPFVAKVDDWGVEFYKREDAKKVREAWSAEQNVHIYFVTAPFAIRFFVEEFDRFGMFPELELEDMAKLSASNDTGSTGTSDSQITRVDLSPKEISEMSDEECLAWLAKLRGNRTLTAPKRERSAAGPRSTKPKLSIEPDENEELG